MRVTCNLKVVDGAVVCPRAEHRTDVEVCRACHCVQAVDADAASGSVRCTPEIESMSRAINALVRA